LPNAPAQGRDAVLGDRNRRAATIARVDRADDQRVLFQSLKRARKLLRLQTLLVRQCASRGGTVAPKPAEQAEAGRADAARIF